MKLHLYTTEVERNAYRKGFKVGSLDADNKQVGPPNSKERTAFWDGVYDRAQYELNRVKKDE